jgi:hypothetical protein
MTICSEELIFQVHFLRFQSFVNPDINSRILEIKFTCMIVS